MAACPSFCQERSMIMNQTLQSFYQHLQGKRVSLIGLGRTHRPLISIFASHGAKVFLRDKRTPEAIGQEECQALKAMGATLIFGENYLEGLGEHSDLILRTPGVHFNLPEIQAARARGVAVTSEQELFFQFCPCPAYGITGSDGKTTTTSIIAALFRAQGKRVFLGGNIGNPLFQMVEEMTPEDVAVVELSNFQLLSMGCSPDVAVVTNVAPNHLDFHKDMEEYIGAKRNIFLHQNGFGRAVLNWDNQITRSFLPQVRGDGMVFSRLGPVTRGTFLAPDGWLTGVDNGREVKIIHKDHIRIPGVHNIENYLAAFAAVWGRVSVENMAAVAKGFGGVAHRIEFIRDLGGVLWYNDSIASSPTRTIAGLNAFQQKIVLIAGGYDKKIPYEPLAPVVLEKGKALILMGATGPKIEEAVAKAAGQEAPKREERRLPGVAAPVMVTQLPQLPIYHAASMEEAVAIANAITEKGDIVSLSPASASFDMYADFEARGNHFKQLVQKLK